MIKLIGAIFAGIVTLASASNTHAQTENFLDLVTKTEAEKFEVEGAVTIDHFLAKRYLEKGHTFIDVRRDVQFSVGHIPGAVSLELKTAFTKESLAKHASKDDCIIFYCSDAQCYRSAHASAMAISWGYENVAYFAGGWSSWNAQGYPRE